VLHLLALGYTNPEIGTKLYVSVRTVDSHRANIMRKLKRETRTEPEKHAFRCTLGASAGARLFEARQTNSPVSVRPAHSVLFQNYDGCGLRQPIGGFTDCRVSPPLGL
jgi:hypothetical protein